MALQFNFYNNNFTKLLKSTSAALLKITLHILFFLKNIKVKLLRYGNEMHKSLDLQTTLALHKNYLFYIVINN